MWIRLALASALFAAPFSAALAAPSRIIILRHGETADAWRLCEIGEQRAEALKYNYLGKNAAKSLFDEDEGPAYVFALTPPAAELASPAVESWNKPIIFYSALPQRNEKDTAEALNERTRAAAANVLSNPALKGKTVVMVWDAKHIADPDLDAKYEREAAVTLRQLFNMDILPGVPAAWPDDTYDYFWIVDFPDNSRVPSKFEMVKQEFGKSFPDVPANDWGAPSGLDTDSGCTAD
jgi:hypothetical protein